MAVSAAAALSSSRVDSVNPIEAENEFRAGIETLLAEVDNQSQQGSFSSDADERDAVFHEHDTRIFFFDRLLDLLGWDLGAGGNVVQEARIKVGTTKFVDYVGVNQDTHAPVLILEAKAWDRPTIKGKGGRRDWSTTSLVIAAVKHINAGRSKASAPVIAEWHEHIAQLAGYVRNFSDHYGHSVSRAVLSSGQWMLVFNDPVSIFCDFDVNDQQFHFFNREEYVAKSHVIFRQLARVHTAGSIPFPIKSSQLGNYLSKAQFSAAFHGMLIRYEASGTPVFTQRPRILVYPCMIIQRDDGVLITVIDAENPATMQISRTGQGTETLGPHLKAVETAAKELLQSCGDELGLLMVPKELAAFPGFPKGSVMDRDGIALVTPQKLFVKLIRSFSDNWLAVTGCQTHFLHDQPKVECRFNTWAACNDVDCAIGTNAINIPSTKIPRAFFVDGQPHHCAHRTVTDRRDARCYIKALDARTCCNACVYFDSCWSRSEATILPCGK
ncbi:MAG: hypothetical protein OXE84_14540 [Rhodobacteraceae bacterium]|nr:hypothetical protein [Paracoccaceae bacterium]